MIKKKTHFVVDLDDGPVCNGNLLAFTCVTDRRMVNCKKCKLTKVYKKGLRKKPYPFNSMDLVHEMVGGDWLVGAQR